MPHIPGPHLPVPRVTLPLVLLLSLFLMAPCPAQAVSLNELAGAYESFMSGETPAEEILPLLDEALQDNYPPDFKGGLYVRRAEVHKQLGQFSEARSDAGQAIVLSPANFGGYAALATVEIASGNYPAATMLLERARELTQPLQSYEQALVVAYLDDLQEECSLAESAMDADTLYAEWQTNQVAAEQTYEDVLIGVRGIISALHRTATGDWELALALKDGTLTCAMEGQSSTTLGALQPGDPVVLMGYLDYDRADDLPSLTKGVLLGWPERKL